MSDIETERARAECAEAEARELKINGLIQITELVLRAHRAEARAERYRRRAFAMRRLATDLRAGWNEEIRTGVEHASTLRGHWFDMRDLVHELHRELGTLRARLRNIADIAKAL